MTSVHNMLAKTMPMISRFCALCADSANVDRAQAQCLGASKEAAPPQTEEGQEQQQEEQENSKEQERP